MEETSCSRGENCSISKNAKVARDKQTYLIERFYLCWHKPPIYSL
jgi:hypothetical protein